MKIVGTLHRIFFLERAQHFLASTRLRTKWLKIKLSGVKSPRHSYCPALILTLMSLLNIPFVPFPSLHSSPSASSSRVSTSFPNRTRFRCNTPSDRENLHKILERKAEIAVRGERTAQQKLCETEARSRGEMLGKEKFGYGSL